MANSKGGKVKGKSHKEGGEKFPVVSTGELVGVEGGEGVLKKSAMESKQEYEIKGTPREITSCLNEQYGGENFRENQNDDCEITPMEPKQKKYQIGGRIKSSKSRKEDYQPIYDLYYEEVPLSNIPTDIQEGDKFTYIVYKKDESNLNRFNYLYERYGIVKEVYSNGSMLVEMEALNDGNKVFDYLFTKEELNQPIKDRFAHVLVYWTPIIQKQKGGKINDSLSEYMVPNEIYKVPNGVGNFNVIFVGQEGDYFLYKNVHPGWEDIVYKYHRDHVPKNVLLKGMGKIDSKQMATLQATKMEKGGKIGFDELSEKVAKNYEGKKVAKKYQKEYGKTYSKKEAEEVGNKVAATVKRRQGTLKAKGGEIKSKDNNPSKEKSQSDKSSKIKAKSSKNKKAIGKKASAPVSEQTITVLKKSAELTKILSEEFPLSDDIKASVKRKNILILEEDKAKIAIEKSSGDIYKAYGKGVIPKNQKKIGNIYEVLKLKPGEIQSKFNSIFNK